MADRRTPGDRLTAALDAASLLILSVGSGDGSQQATIVARGHVNLATTFLDSREAVLLKYPSAKDHIETLARAARPVLFGIDAMKLDTYPDLGKFDIVMFSFPHTGVRDDDAQNVPSNQALLGGFLRSVAHVLREGVLTEVQITMKTGVPYDQWSLPGLLTEACALHLGSQHSLDKQAYPGYVHRLTKGTNFGSLSSVRDDGAQVYVFEPRDGARAPGARPVPLGELTSVTIVALVHAALTEEEARACALDLLRSSSAEERLALTVLNIRRRFERPNRDPSSQWAVPDTRQLNRVLYALEGERLILRGAPGSQSQKPKWRLADV
ncbi:hypothetical protein T492DRAFT_1073878 [Pavlovales sp. CCMP2436]|nr:hypothetical protein T492DRAFT_1073878 [Pavlovales sp. CCMP2436]